MASTQAAVPGSTAYDPNNAHPPAPVPTTHPPNIPTDTPAGDSTIVIIAVVVSVLVFLGGLAGALYCIFWSSTPLVESKADGAGGGSKKNSKGRSSQLKKASSKKASGKSKKSSKKPSKFK